MEILNSKLTKDDKKRTDLVKALLHFVEASPHRRWISGQQDGLDSCSAGEEDVDRSDAGDSASDVEETLADSSEEEVEMPTPKAPSASSLTPDLAGFLGSLNTTQHVLEMFRRTLPEEFQRSILERLANRLTKIASEARKLDLK